MPLNSFHKALMQSKEEPSYTPRKQVRVQFSVAPSQRHLELAGTGPLEDDAIIVHDDDDEREVEMLVSSSPVPSGKFDREDHESASSDVERPVNNPFIVPLKFSFQSEQKLYLVLPCVHHSLKHLSGG